jgi:hypothetical protein
MVMLLIGGVAAGLWLSRDQEDYGADLLEWDRPIFITTAFVLGGLSLIGPPLLLLNSRYYPWGEGRFLWFVLGSAAWLTWPGIALLGQERVRMHWGGRCSALFMYGTPLIALCHMIGLLGSGRLGSPTRHRLRQSWQECFGLILGLGWAITGLYVAALFYWGDLL